MIVWFSTLLSMTLQDQDKDNRHSNRTNTFFLAMMLFWLKRCNILGCFRVGCRWLEEYHDKNWRRFEQLNFNRFEKTVMFRWGINQWCQTLLISICNFFDNELVHISNHDTANLSITQLCDVKTEIDAKIRERLQEFEIRFLH